MPKKKLKETKYCLLLKQGKVIVEDSIFSVERIYVKVMEREEIRFGLYKENKNQIETLIPRPVDVTEEELLQLISEGKSKGVFSKKFIEELKEIIQG